MRDVFYTILIIWIIGRVLNSITAYRAMRANKPGNNNPRSNSSGGDTTVEFEPPTKKKFNDDEGEYVDFEEVKQD